MAPGAGVPAAVRWTVGGCAGAPPEEGAVPSARARPGPDAAVAAVVDALVDAVVERWKTAGTAGWWALCAARGAEGVSVPGVAAGAGPAGAVCSARGEPLSLADGEPARGVVSARWTTGVRGRSSPARGADGRTGRPSALRAAPSLPFACAVGAGTAGDVGVTGRRGAAGGAVCAACRWTGRATGVPPVAGAAGRGEACGSAASPVGRTGAPAGDVPGTSGRGAGAGDVARRVAEGACRSPSAACPPLAAAVSGDRRPAGACGVSLPADRVGRTAGGAVLRVRWTAGVPGVLLPVFGVCGAVGAIGRLSPRGRGRGVTGAGADGVPGRTVDVARRPASPAGVLGADGAVGVAGRAPSFTGLLAPRRTAGVPGVLSPVFGVCGAVGAIGRLSPPGRGCGVTGAGADGAELAVRCTAGTSGVPPPDRVGRTAGVAAGAGPIGAPAGLPPLDRAGRAVGAGADVLPLAARRTAGVPARLSPVAGVAGCRAGRAGVSPVAGAVVEGAGSVVGRADGVRGAAAVPRVTAGAAPLAVALSRLPLPRLWLRSRLWLWLCGRLRSAEDTCRCTGLPAGPAGDADTAGDVGAPGAAGVAGRGAAEADPGAAAVRRTGAVVSAPERRAGAAGLGAPSLASCRAGGRSDTAVSGARWIGAPRAGRTGRAGIPGWPGAAVPRGGVGEPARSAAGEEGCPGAVLARGVATRWTAGAVGAEPPPPSRPPPPEADGGPDAAAPGPPVGSAPRAPDAGSRRNAGSTRRGAPAGAVTDVVRERGCGAVLLTGRTRVPAGRDGAGPGAAARGAKVSASGCTAGTTGGETEGETGRVVGRSRPGTAGLAASRCRPALLAGDRPSRMAGGRARTEEGFWNVASCPPNRAFAIRCSGATAGRIGAVTLHAGTTGPVAAPAAPDGPAGGGPPASAAPVPAPGRAASGEVPAPSVRRSRRSRKPTAQPFVSAPCTRDAICCT
ncbi:hypothetical protein [Streptomyces sp. NRRL F-2890]|uniref:hypothetical protein n=1 Tax=Streptomyces sp. NRRL F-2890 TaxID=1463845 RepID=UPI00131A4BF4|nr:hypothetical protein [Streptomyces sp. NRRL F-2890]